jgi:ABC-type transport system involved in multi-copper enzyme maturation permease subunit
MHYQSETDDRRKDMFTLIKREIEDNMAYFLAAALFSALIIIASLAVIYQRNSDNIIELSLSFLLPTFPLMLVGFAAMGVSHMYMDKSRKISGFLSTLPVSRKRILLARIITGILAILILLVPLAVTTVILQRLFAPSYPVYAYFIPEIFTGVLLMGFACYCLGLQTGWTSGKVVPTLGGIVLTCVLVTLIFFKGFGLDTIVILLLLIIASLIRTWQKFMSASL